MKTKTIFTTWVPRIIAVVYICFLVLLSFDVFNMNGTFIEKLGGFAVQNIPTVLLVITLLIAWKKEKAGGGLFIAMAALFTCFFNTYGRWDSFLLISFPLLLTGILFLFGENK